MTIIRTGDYISDLDVRPQPDKQETQTPEPLKRVRVLAPFLVAHDGTAHWPNAVVEVPESVAAHWLLNQWVELDKSRRRK
ncbi:hypothetical protein [Mycobacterium mantenii]|uniref:Uncharacterized protein n=1 Tax=Mycobacterium mantenii TaxID=560555 RepID=A0A1A2T267_MYCNT|nr:hypothetical protein [Mycobacterium mantenii]OBH43376.1 hypothetical protein A5688_12665 [Mycobacterium mantenii]OBH48913.1 hypothetical protein A5687_14955 [Mycobacterium mantenii]OBH70401.1 hypothetical protein A5683_00310 [Mycobacterium mantenii]